MKVYKKYFFMGVVILLILATGFILPFMRKVADTTINQQTLPLPKNQQTLSPKVSMSERNTVGFGACRDMRAEIDGLFEKAKNCQQDSDCIADNKGMYCPFGCYQIHNKNADISEIMKKVVEFQNSKCYLCEYSCMTPPTQGDLKCQQNRCINVRYLSEK